MVDALSCSPVIVFNAQNCFQSFTCYDLSGPEASVSILTDFICAAQMAREEDLYLPEDDLKVDFLIYLMRCHSYTYSLLSINLEICC